MKTLLENLIQSLVPRLTNKKLKISLYALLLLLMVSGAGYWGYQVVLADIYGSSLVGWWTLDSNHYGTGAGAVTDSSGTGNNSTQQNTPTMVAGKLGQALSFNGSSQYVDAGTSASLDVDYVTVSVWVKANSWAASGYNNIVSKDTVAAPYEGYVLRNELNQLQFVITDVGTGAEHKTVATLPSTGVWHHIVGTFDGVNSKLYLDGVLLQTTSAASGVLRKATGRSLYIGEDQSFPGRWFNGSLDDVRIYNRALSAAEVAQLYEQGLGRFNSFNDF